MRGSSKNGGSVRMGCLFQVWRSVYLRVGNSRFEVYKKGGKTVISVFKGAFQNFLKYLACGYLECEKK